MTDKLQFLLKDYKGRFEIAKESYETKALLHDLVGANYSKGRMDVWEDVIEELEQIATTQEILANKNIGFEYVNFSEDKSSTSFAVPSEEQIHILGNKQDIEGFKEFVSKSVQSASNEVNFEEKDVTSAFSVKPEKNDVTSTFSLGSASESTENADEGIGNSASEKLEEFYNSLSLPQKLSLQQQKIANLADLEKESKKDFYKDVDDFIDQLKKCF